MRQSSAFCGPELGEVLALLGQIESVKTQLKAMGVLRSDRDASCDFAEWWAARVCGLKLVENTVNAGYDAKDRRGRLYQIKSRRVVNLDAATSFNFGKLGEFDYLVPVFLAGSTLKPLGVYRVPRKFVEAHLSENLRFRWHRGVRASAERAGYGPLQLEI